MENLSQGIRKRACSRFPSVGGVGRYLASENVSQAAQLLGSPHQLTSSQSSQGSEVEKIWDSQIIVNLPVTNVQGCVGSNAKTLGLQDLQFLDMGAGGGPPNGTRIVHHGTDELLIQQNTIPDGETTSIQERSQRSQSLCRFLSYPIDVLTR